MQNFIEQIQECKNLNDLEALRVAVLGKKGILTESFAKLKDLAGEEKKEFAAKLNSQKDAFNEAYLSKFKILENLALEEKMKQDALDFNYFDESPTNGALHSVMSTMDRIIEYFVNFYFDDKRLLRTQTSPVQIRTMLAQKPPIRMIAPGAVFRRDFDITHTPMFHQVEGLVVEEGQRVSFANLKSILEDFLRYMFGDVKVRFRPSFFPFTEPSAEVDISCVFCKGCGCRVCKQTGWLEVLGCGVVDPNVFNFVGYKDVSGYAFGLGVERFAMLLHQIPDLRSLFEGDLRLLEQFR